MAVQKMLLRKSKKQTSRCRLETSVYRQREDNPAKQIEKDKQGQQLNEHLPGPAY